MQTTTETGPYGRHRRNRPTDRLEQGRGHRRLQPSERELGSVYNFMVDKRSGQVEYAVMSFGGFLGIGDSYHPLPWKSLTYDTSQGGYVVDLDKNALQGAPSYSSSEAPDWSDPSYSRRIDDYYGPFPGV